MMMGRWFGGWGYDPFINGGGWWMMGIGMLFNILFWGVLIYLAIRFLNKGGFGSFGGNHGETPEEILRKRYARGEITREEYQQMLEDLKK
ncbi:SHOCT domain-containing protein [Carboxydocella sp. ULO1]|uniref:SHOCT domain-containing protein n=1 Tax=Carboxydocella sp. ULO1 TaxID=1926599 RepID=UPI001FA8CF28|nr:SHOCT domain-containing protein [Carboxydocella sp. ULO1]